ncbi:transporter substrate-binding domain-containing protein [Paraburkholderia phenoliruptrix]|uniref:transporter substrate-binding domain-containing protein n=1 Tax=Paraburkholderia phenoliruptrix TaxID=252970 RepID=UPI002869C529|nr:transporter substrate-binding domain-containing protein [Paraburkholderia phenoliruptrix]WMY10909.1 transporter substrate-binding domain-containing protein [Paraburkholderia phenoliruptrix]
MNVTIAYIEEPPFGWTDYDGVPKGADLELANTVLRAIGITQIEHRLTTFSELLPGVEAGRWDMNVPLFVTPERAGLVAFSLPVWAISDGFLIRAGNLKGLRSYASLAERPDARLGIIAGQVQHQSAKEAGVADEQIVIFEEQAEAIEAVRSEAIDAYASTALGNRILAERIGDSVVAVDHEAREYGDYHVPVGAFSFNKSNTSLINAVNGQLRSYLGSQMHRATMAKYGLTNREIDPAVVRRADVEL